jgi:hypothetical protein
MFFACNWSRVNPLKSIDMMSQILAQSLVSFLLSFSVLTHVFMLLPLYLTRFRDLLRDDG